ncbi:MAG: DUF4175 family protein [Elusimicrobia bacterium]|nr:DUF4175 family protein [Elusimicrobiota bacterium]
MSLEDWVSRCRRQYGAWLLVEHGSRLAAWSAAAVTAALAVDAAAPLPLDARRVLFVAGLCAFAAAAHRRLAAPWRRMRAQQLLRRLEEREPGLAAYLVSAWELRGAAPAGTSQELAREHLARAEALLERARPAPLYPTGLSTPARRVFLASALWCAAAGCWLWHASPGPGRLLAPWRERPLDELLVVSPGAARLPWGAPVELSASWRDGRRETPELWLKTGPSVLGRVPLEPEDRGRFHYALSALDAPAEYQWRWRGERTRRFGLEPVPRPQLTGARLRVYPPGRESGVFQEVALEGAGEVAALRGSWIVAAGRPNVPLAKASARVSFLDLPVEMRRAADGSWEGGFPLREDGRLQFDLASAEGMTDPSPVSWSLRALADQPPKIELLSPAFEVEAGPRDRLELAYHADDDFGLTGIWLVARFPGPKGIAERSLKLSRGRLGKESYGDHSWDLSSLPVGARVEFQLRADDDASPRPQSGWSQKNYVRLLDFEKAHAQVEKQWGGLEQTLGKLAEREAMLKKLSVESEAGTPGADARSAEREETERQASSDWRAAADAAKSFAQAMADDAYSNPGMAEEAKALEGQIQEAASSEFPKAVDAAKRGDFAQAQRRHADLEQRARAAAKRLADGRSMQSLQDFWTEADRMDQTGAELSQALEDMAKGKTPTADEKRRLDEALAKLQREMEDLAKAIDSLPKSPEGSPQDSSRKQYRVPLGGALRAADALQRALAAGDYAAAAKLAQELSKRLSRVRQAIGEAARDQAGGMGAAGDDRLSEKLEQAVAAWDKVIDEQTKSVGQAQKLEDAKTQELLRAQKDLLDQLRERQERVVRRGEKLGVRMPPDALGWMRAVLDEFRRKAVSQSPELLHRTILRLKGQAAAQPAEALELVELAGGEQAILEDLLRGAQPPPATPQTQADAASAATTQGQVRQKTAALQRQVEDLSRDAGSLPGSVTEPLESAQVQQRAAEDALGSADSGGALGHEQSALEQLEKGRQALEDAAQQQRSIESGLGRPFGGRTRMVRRAGGMSGANTGFVPLPSAKDYQPPRQLRQELERSLHERRPAAYDPIIQEYFRRMSE